MTANENKCFKCNEPGAVTEYCNDCMYGNPKDLTTSSNQFVRNLTFGQAVELLKQGKKVKREAWGGYWFIKDTLLGDAYEDNEGVWRLNDGDNNVEPNAHTLMIVAKLKDGGYAPATPYQADIIAEDWEIVEWKI